MRNGKARYFHIFWSLGALFLFPLVSCTTNLSQSSLSSSGSGSSAAGVREASPAEAAVSGEAEGADVADALEAAPEPPATEGAPDAPAMQRPPAVLASAELKPEAPALPADQASLPPLVETVGNAPAAPAAAPQAASDPVAVPRPAPAAAKPPVQLSAVPRTSVEARPTNQIMMVRTTAYSHLEADSLQYGNKSAAGTPLRYGSQVRSAAADWSKYPLGTRFMIEGLPYVYEVDDYGSALAGTETLDIYKPNLAGIRQWGARNVPVRVIEWGSFEESRRILESRKHVRHAHHVRQMLSEIERKAKQGKLDVRPAGLGPAPGGGA